MSTVIWVMLEQYAEDADDDEATWGFQGVYDSPERAAHVILCGMSQKSISVVAREADEWIIKDPTGAMYFIRRQEVNEGTWACEWSDYDEAAVRAAVDNAPVVSA